MKPDETIIVHDDFNEVITHYTNRLGYRLEMIKPADSPREALLSNNGESIKLIQTNQDQRATNEATWITGRAGMMYRDLIPDRLGGKIIASQIRLIKGGTVDDYVHYHKVDFQMIHCLRGRIKVVYESQGPPFWLDTGDWIIQPPEIRHRVLECTAMAEVVEISMPAEHETWVDHEMTLPTNDVNPDREFMGQRFVRHIAALA